MTFSEHLRYLRGTLTQSAFCRRVRIPLTTYQRYEKGERVPDIEVFSRIVKTVGIPADTLLGLNGTLQEGSESKPTLARLSSSCSSNPKDVIIAHQVEIIETLTRSIVALSKRTRPI